MHPLEESRHNGKQNVPGWVVGILDIGNRDCGIGDSIVDNSVHRHCHRVPRQDLVVEKECIEPTQLLNVTHIVKVIICRNISH